MILKSLKLENIRSYNNQRIDFPAGSILLAGDIGAGKSSVLLAIEFALFGIRRKHLSGEALLRNGKSKGSVLLNFEIEGKDIIIKRELVRKKDSVEQDKGYVVVNGLKKEGTAVELKAEIINLLGYPRELLTKSKNLVYRYTVYTPQEEMKQILLEEEEARLGTLRKVFGIDKYKRVRENSLIFIKELKEKITMNQGMIADLEEKKKHRLAKEEDIKKIEKEIIKLEPNLNEIKQKVKSKKERIALIENRIQKQNNLKRELEVAEVNLRNILEQRDRNKQNTGLIEKQIIELNNELQGKGEADLNKVTEERRIIEESIILEERRLRGIEKRINELGVKKRHSVETKDKVINFDKCPTCEQNVGEEYKKLVSKRVDKEVAGFDQEIEKYSEQSNIISDKNKKLNLKLGELMKKQNELSAIAVKIKNLQEKQKTKQDLLVQQENLKKRIGEINVKKLELDKKLSLFKDVTEEYGRLRPELDVLLEEEKRVEKEKYGLEREKQSLTNYLVELEKEIEKKQKAKAVINRLSETKNWLDRYFINLMSIMEKQIMLKVYYDFNSAFQEWFNCLIEDEGITARLDNSFSPIIEQNGYEISVNNLSGGERTACALAYRLSLNKTINDLIGGIKTKDLIILDEPTDGFSNEQLDKVRAVLDQLNVHQTILVSHESKIESFVDHVIRIGKQEHSSFVV